MSERVQSSGLDEYLSITQHLKQLFLLPSPSGAEKGVRLYCRTALTDAGFIAEQDDGGNLLASRGDEGAQRTLLTAHMDTAQQVRDVEVLAQSNSAALAFPERGGLLQIEGQDSGGETVCIGANDKCGIAIILALAEVTDLPFRVLLSVQAGGENAGAKAVDADFFAGLDYCLCLDRPGKQEIVSAYNGRATATDWFIDRLMIFSRELGLAYSWADGEQSDAHTISYHVPQVASLSVGYGSYPSPAADYARVIDVVHAMRLVAAHLSSE